MITQFLTYDQFQNCIKQIEKLAIDQIITAKSAAGKIIALSRLYQTQTENAAIQDAAKLKKGQKS